MKPKVISTHINSFHLTVRGGQKVIVFTRSEQWATGTVATFVDAVEAHPTGEDITSQFSAKELGEMVFHGIACPR
jgi:hypothetical protein